MSGPSSRKIIHFAIAKRFVSFLILLGLLVLPVVFCFCVNCTICCLIRSTVLFLKKCNVLSGGREERENQKLSSVPCNYLFLAFCRLLRDAGFYESMDHICLLPKYRRKAAEIAKQQAKEKQRQSAADQVRQFVNCRDNDLSARISQMIEMNKASALQTRTILRSME